ncbi:uncharacterized protein LOC120251587 isoform X1 [Dioscorea cayenensis subsp. rotundata]|uniref:Uncharacterized protein LOC120251587 isoform X1 n=1 Tax=Dioscorea cayennensis subsp. rotundata TaxID=55577 RepID=A0AB40AML6_DIOCR|nr:uncharacterized protein LOC120251587 isoform X1 [Dioscorea cayenensis subsp. rotundata]
MDYDFRTRTAPAYRPAGAGTASTMYPRVGQPGAPPPARAPYHHSTSSSPQSAGLGIRVTIKPEYQIRPPPPLAAQMPNIPRSTFQFDFDFERRILAEAEKETQNWGKIAGETQPTKTAPSSMAPAGDPLVDKYVASGLGREAVSLAVLNYGDNPIKVREFVKGYNLLREMGFSSKNVAEALAMYDNDTDKALAHFLNSSS